MLIVHIGLPKAGSATLQTYLTTNEADLRDKSIDYVRLGRRIGRESSERLISAHHNFANELKERKTLFRPEVGSIDDLSKYAAECRHETMIVSSEMFENCDSDSVGRFKDALSACGNPVLIVMIMRDFMSLVPSSYAQKIKRGFNIYDFDTFFDLRVEQERANYFNTANNWATHFGWENMRVRLLDENHLVNGDLIDDFLTCIGIEAGDPAIRSLPRQKRVNESSGWKTLEATRALFSGRHGLGEHHPLPIFVSGGSTVGDNRSLRRAGGKRFETVAVKVAARQGWTEKGRYLLRWQAQRCLDTYETSLRQLNEMLSQKLPPAPGLDERGFVERDFLPDASHIPPGELCAFYDEAWSELSRQGDVAAIAKRQRKASERTQKQLTRRDAERCQKDAASLEAGRPGVAGAPLAAGHIGGADLDKKARKAAKAARKAAKAARRGADLP